MSKSKEKCSQRSRINSSLNGCKKEIQSGNLLEEMMIKPTKQKRTMNMSLKNDTSKIEPSKSMKIRRL